MPDASRGVTIQRPYQIGLQFSVHHLHLLQLTAYFSHYCHYYSIIAVDCLAQPLLMPPISSHRFDFICSHVYWQTLLYFNNETLTFSRQQVHSKSFFETLPATCSKATLRCYASIGILFRLTHYSCGKYCAHVGCSSNPKLSKPQFFYSLNYI